jgi:hypothetical protein
MRVWAAALCCAAAVATAAAWSQRMAILPIRANGRRAWFMWQPTEDPVALVAQAFDLVRQSLSRR